MTGEETEIAQSTPRFRFDDKAPPAVPAKPAEEPSPPPSADAIAFVSQVTSDPAQAARQRGFDACWLSELVFAAETAGAIDFVEESVSEDVLEKLGACAAKWFHGTGTPRDGAAQYFRMNMIEKRAVQFAFPRSIFVTFNGSEFRSLFPDRMPIFYMYSLRRGTGVKPWFLPSPEVPAMPAVVAAE
jgi:hypothetical protein